MKRTTRLFAVSFLSTCLLVPAMAQRVYCQQDAVFDDSSELRLQDFRIVKERTVEPGTSEVDVLADLKNVGPALWSSAVATLVAGSQDLEIVQGELRFATVPSTGSASPDGVWTVRVPSEQVVGLTDDLETRTIRYRVIGEEITVYAGNSFVLDEETDDAFYEWVGAGVGGWIYMFDRETPLLEAIGEGDLLVEDPLPMGYRSRNGMEHLLPRKVVSKKVHASGRVVLDCGALDPTDYVSGSFEVSFDHEGNLGETLDFEDLRPLQTGCYTGPLLEVEEDGPRCEFRGLPLRFNDLELATGLKASGEIRLGAGVAGVQVRFRNFAPTRLVIDLAVSYSASFEIRAEAGAGVPKTEKTLFSLGLPIFTTTVGGVPVSITLDVDLLAGAKADLRAEGVTSVSQSSKLGVRFGISNGDVIVDPYSTQAPFHFTPPHLTRSSGLDLKGWAGVDATLSVNGVRGPFLRATGYGRFRVQPAREREWEIKTGIELEAGVRAGFQTKRERAGALVESGWRVHGSRQRAGHRADRGRRRAGGLDRLQPEQGGDRDVSRERPGCPVDDDL